ncbi:predicted protein [Botrytis cinerea T4]|uniref:Uncharacterized protein n=1 Tax=Botryotinia fuckeliana (strain T4) TaxID=999810 RepID=G2YDK8_BOTF4|nr:predicted protein [Botrytis cinerea T4]
MSSFKISETYTMLDMYFYISRDILTNTNQYTRCIKHGQHVEVTLLFNASRPQSLITILPTI